MLTLSFDASTAVLTVALMKGNRCLDQLENRERKTHAEQLMPAIDLLLKRNNLSVQELELVAAGHGPGSYTGIRIALATALGLTSGTSTPLVTVSTLQAITPAEDSGIIYAVLDARGGRVYAGGYRQNVCLYEDRQTTAEALAQHIAKMHGGEMVTLAGNGAAAVAQSIGTARVWSDAWPQAVRLGELGRMQYERMGRGLGDAEVRPFYAAPTQAERLAGQT